MKRIVVLLSGRGSNMSAIARTMRSERWPATIAGVIADRPGAAGLQLAAGLGLPTAVVDYRGFARREDFEQALREAIDALAPDAVVLAGFMRVLGAAFVEHYRGRMLNIHPSLLPAFPGLATHRRALQAGVAVHGATVHFVGTEVDGGPIVAQAAVPVQPDDDEAKLSARVLDAEHRLYPMVVRWFVEDRLRLDGTRVRLAEPRPGESRLLWSDAR
jgi:phosphoribosylglycinamide formyltransferase-1